MGYSPAINENFLVSPEATLKWRRLKRAVESASDNCLPQECKAIIFVEGLTEQVLLPYIASAYSLNLADRGAIVVAAGGADQLVRKYLYVRDKINLPIFCIFDRDAQAYAAHVLANLRLGDQVHVLADGEIEDLMRLDFLVSKLNRYLAADPLNDYNQPVEISDFYTKERRTFILDRIWRQRTLGKFDKVGFAKFIAGEPPNQDMLSIDGKRMLAKLTRSISS